MGLPETEVDRLLQAARLHLAQGELHEAAERAAEAIRLEGGRSDAYLLRAEALRRLKKPERALADLAVAIRLAPDRPGPYIVRAEILKRRNVFDQAIADATHALILDPRNASAFSVRAQCRHAVGDREGADDDVRAMLEIDPTRPVPNLGAGLTPGGAASAMESDEERIWKRAGDGGRGEDRTTFAGGGPVDETYRSRPVVSDEEAPLVLGRASGYKPEVLARPITRRRGRTMRSPGHRGGHVLILGVAVVVGCGLWLAFRGSTGPLTDARPVEPQSPQFARPKAPQSAPALIEPDATGATKVASAQVEPLGLDPVVKDLGSFSLNKAGRAWEVVMPDRFTKAEAAFYRGDPSDRTLNAAWEGHLQINGKDVVRFRGSPRQGIFLFHDSTTGADYEEVNDYKRREPERLLDVTAYLHPGENSFYYYHEQRPDLPMGLVLSITGGTASPPVAPSPPAEAVESPPDRRSLDGHTGVVLGVAFSPDGSRLASASGDGTVRLWDLGEGGGSHVVLGAEEPKPVAFVAVAFSPDGRTLAASKLDGRVVLWDVSDARPKLQRTIQYHDNPVIALAFSPDGTTLVTAGRNRGVLAFWDVTKPSDTPRTTQPAERNCGVWSLAFSPDGATLAEGVAFPAAGGVAPPGEVWLWDVRRWPYVKRAEIKEPRKVPRSLAYSPDGSRLAFGDGDVAVVLDAAAGKASGSFGGHSSFVVGVAFTPDGRRCVSAGYDKTIRLWNAASTKAVRSFEGHTDSVECVAVSPDGRLAASAGHDKTIRIWRLPEGR